MCSCASRAVPAWQGARKAARQDCQVSREIPVLIRDSPPPTPAHHTPFIINQHRATSATHLSLNIQRSAQRQTRLFCCPSTAFRRHLPSFHRLAAVFHCLSPPFVAVFHCLSQPGQLIKDARLSRTRYDTELLPPASPAGGRLQRPTICYESAANVKARRNQSHDSWRVTGALLASGRPASSPLAPRTHRRH